MRLIKAHLALTMFTIVWNCVCQYDAHTHLLLEFYNQFMKTDYCPLIIKKKKEKRTTHEIFATDLPIFAVRVQFTLFKVRNARAKNGQRPFVESAGLQFLVN